MFVFVSLLHLWLFSISYCFRGYFDFKRINFDVVGLYRRAVLFSLFVLIMANIKSRVFV